VEQATKKSPAGGAAVERPHAPESAAGARRRSPPAASRAGVADDSTASIVLRTLLLIDLVDSTGLVERLGDLKAHEVFTLHDRLVRDLLARFDGREIDKTDGFLLLFERPADAVCFAIAYHDEVARLAAELDVDLRARAGIHLGEVCVSENAPEDVRRGAKPLEVEGLAKPLAARVMSLAQGGQTLLTHAAWGLARRALAAADLGCGELRWLAHGKYRLRGIAEPVEIFEVGVPGVAPLDAPPSTTKARRVRRASPAVAALVLLLALALALAAYFFAGRERGQPAPVRSAVAVLGFKNLGDPSSAWLSTALAELLTTELAAGEDLRLIPGESVARMKQDLALPEADGFAAATLERIRQHLGTDFVVVGSYLVLPRGADRIVGLQLKLQDAAAGETVSSVKEEGPEADLFELVSRASRELRRKLAVGELSSGKAAAVRATLSASPEATRLYAEGLAALRAYDVLRARDLFGQAVQIDPGYALAHAALAEAWLALGYDREAEASARRAYELAEDFPREEQLSIEARYYEAATDWDKAVASYRVLWGFFPDNVDYGIRLANAQIRAGRWQDALATVATLHRLPPPGRDDPRIDLVEGEAYYQLSDLEASLAAFRRAIDKGRELEVLSLVAEGFLGQGWAYLHTGQRQLAATAFTEARQLFSTSGDLGKVAEVLNSLGYLDERRGELRDAEQLFRQGLAIFRQTGNRKQISLMLLNVGNLLRVRGDLTESQRMLEESLAIAREIGSERREAVALTTLARLHLDRGEIEQARDLVRQSSVIFNRTGQRWDGAWTRILEGDVALAAGQVEEARQQYQQALAILAEVGDESVSAFALHGLGRVQLLAGELEAAARRFDEARAVRQRLGEQGRLAQTQLALAELEIERRRPAQAEELIRRAAEVLEREGRRDEQIRAAILLSRVRALRGDAAAARGALVAVREMAEASENPAARMAFAIAEARLDRRGDPAAARRVLAAVLAEAQSRGLIPLELEARFALAEIELAGPDPGVGRARLEGLVAAARGRGLGLLAARAATVLAGTPPPTG